MIEDCEERIKNGEQRIKMLSGELKNCLEAWEMEKNSAVNRYSKKYYSPGKDEILGMSE